jgi:hypothetical protein
MNTNKIVTVHVRVVEHQQRTVNTLHSNGIEAGGRAIGGEARQESKKTASLLKKTSPTHLWDHATSKSCSNKLTHLHLALAYRDLDLKQK